MDVEAAVAAIKSHIGIINRTAVDTYMLDFSVREVLDRVLIYLNRTDVPEQLVRPLTGIVDGMLRKYTSNSKAERPDQAISSISDNGQSVSYSENLARYLISATDDEIFGGFTKLMNRYRRPNVVYPEQL